MQNVEKERMSEQVEVPANKENARKQNMKIGLFTLVGILIAASVFTSGYLFGSGKLTFKSDSFIPTASVGKAPTDGLDELYRELQLNFDGDISDEDILIGMKEGMAAAADDPFTEFLTEKETEDFNSSLNGSFEGIGAELGKEGSFVSIVAPLKGTPADEAGLQPGDLITTIDGEDAFDISISEAVTRIRGPKGEEVVLTLVRDGNQFDVTIVRDTITIDSVEWEIADGVGTITISRFGNDTTQLAQQAAREIKEAGVNKVILDLRGNPGGLLDTSVEVASIWLPRGSVVLEEKQDGTVVQTYTTKDQPILNGTPTVVLINGGSASASEIVAGAFKDLGAATVMGETSYGKGSVQRLIPLRGGGSLKVTIARWFTPNGTSIDKEGVSPDVEVELTSEDIENDLDPQLDAAKDYFNQ